MALVYQGLEKAWKEQQQEVKVRQKERGKHHKDRYFCSEILFMATTGAQTRPHLQWF